jgi:FkbM family methyltransferase
MAFPILPAKILGRSQKRALTSIFRFPRVVATAMATRFFRQPLKVLKCYIGRTCPKDLCVQTRSGYKIHLTGDADDLVTLLVVMGRRDYGKIPQQGVVIDVGGHLGAFTLYAVEQGAQHVYCYEPDPVLYDALLRNVKENGLEADVTPCRAAVVGSVFGQVRFCPEGNASGHVAAPHEVDGIIMVNAITLAEIVLDNQIDCVDLLKLDCEGNEYGIALHTPKEIWSRIWRVRLEYHNGRVEELRERFEDLGYSLTRAVKNSREVGLLWFDRR